MKTISRVGNTGKVMAFEPSVANCTLLHKSLQVNHFENVVLHNVAVAETASVVGFRMHDSNGSILPEHLSSHAEQVHAVTLDQVLGDEPRIDLIKMDIEGAEGRALQGMHRVIQRCHPMIFTELNPSALQAVSIMTPEEYLNQLRAFDYVLCVVHRTTGQQTTVQSNAQIMHAWVDSKLDHVDLVAYPQHTTLWFYRCSRLNSERADRPDVVLIPLRASKATTADNCARVYTRKPHVAESYALPSKPLSVPPQAHSSQYGTYPDYMKPPSFNVPVPLRYAPLGPTLPL